jgi:hypothetical protein
MHRLRLLTFTSLAVLSSCTPPDAALRVNVAVRAQGAARVRADCIRLTISNETQELKSLTIKRPTDDDAVFAVRKGTDLPGTVKVQATGLLGTNCSDDTTLKLNAQGEAVTGVFPESGVSELSVVLDPPNSTLDADRDGFVAAARGGLDCRDDDNSVFPGANQVCANTADTDCDGQGGCDDSECGTAAVCADPPDRLVITGTVTTMLRYECRGPFRVELRNPSGVRKAVRDTVVALSSSLPGVTVHGTSSCSDAALSTSTIAYDATFLEVYLKADGQAFGLNTLTASSLPQVAMPGTIAVEVHPQPIDRLAFITPTRTVSAGTCSTEPVTLEYLDSQNRRTDVDVPTTITVVSNPGDVLGNIFFSDPACTIPSAANPLLPGQGRATVYLLAGTAGTFTLSVTGAPGAPTQPLTVTPAGPAKLAFTNNPLVLSTTQSCSAGLFTVQLQDRFDNPTNAVADLVVRMSVSGLQGVSLFENVNNCMNAAQMDFTIPAGSNSVSLRASGMTASSTAGSILATVTNVPNITAVSQVLRISAGTATKFRLTGSAQMPLASVCSANPVTIELLDSSDNAASSPVPVSFTLSTNPPGDSSFRFFSGAGCQVDLGGTITVPAGQTSATFYFRGNRAIASFEIRAAGVLTAPSTFLGGNSIRAGAPGKLQFVAPLTQTTQAGTCTANPYVANVLDLFDNPTSFTAPQTVTVSSNPVGATVGTSTCNSGNTVQLAAGAQQVSFIAQHTVTTPVTPYALTATVNGFSTPTPVTMNVTPGLSTLIVDAPLGGNSSLMAGGCQQVTLSRRDAFNNNAPTSGATPITLAFPPATNWVVYSSTNCTTGAGASIGMNSTHTVSFSVSPRSSGNHQMTASINAGAQTAVVNFQVTAGTPSLVFETPNTGTNAATATQTAGGCTAVTVARKDAFGNDVPMGGSGGTLSFSFSAMGTTAHTAATCLPGNVTTGIALSSTEARATFYVSATRSSATGGPAMQNIGATLASQTATLTLTVNPGAPVLSMTSPATNAVTLTANQCQIITLERRDAFTNLVPVPTAMNVTVAPAGLTLFSSTDCTGTPLVNVPVTALASTRSFSVRTTLASAAVGYTFTLDGQNVPLNITVNPGPTTKLLVEGLNPTLTARNCSSLVTIRRQDFWNNNVTAEPNLTVTLSSSRFQFSSNSGCTGLTAGATVTIAMGSSTSGEMLYASATQAGMATLTANATAPSGTVTGGANSTISAGPATKLFFLDAPGSVVSGACSASGRVELRDQDDNPVTPSGNVNVTFASSPGTPTFFSAAGCTGGMPLVLTAAQRIGTFSFRPTTAPASEVITASSGSLTPVSQTWNVNVGPATKMVWKVDPTTPAARFTCVAAGTIEIQDANNNVSPNTTGSNIVVTLTPNPAATSGVTYFSDAACTNPVTTVPIPNLASETAPFFMVATGASPVNLSATSVPALTAPPNRPVALTGTGSLVVTPVDPLLEAGACIALTIERRNNANAPFALGTTSVNIPVLNAIASLHLMSDCSDAAASSTVNRVIANGSSTTTVYVRGRSAAPSGGLPIDAAVNVDNALGGAGASTSGLTTLKVLPLVRRGGCNITDTNTESRCNLVPAIPGNVINRSFLMFTSTGRQPITGPTQMRPADQNAECHLENGTVAQVVCTRQGANGQVNINYQVVSFGRDAASGSGISVQHETFATTAATTTFTLDAPVDTSRSFLITSNNMNGTDNDGDAFPVVRFPTTGASVGTVEVVANTATPTRQVSLQVVTLGFAGAAVNHVSTTNPAQTTGGFTIPTSTTAVGTTFALATAQVTANSTNLHYMCKRRLNVKVGGANVTMHRGVGSTPSANCTTDAVVLSNVQRVHIPTVTATRVPADVTMVNSDSTASTAAFTAVAPHRSITFLMMQGAGGQTAGESDFGGTNDDDDDTGAFHATLDFNAGGTQVNLVRTEPDNCSSTFSPIVVQFDP